MTQTAAPRKLQVGKIGELVPRLDAPPKVKGEFAYASDLIVPGMLWGRTLRSPHAHARILSIDISEALTVAGVHAVLTHDDVPGMKTYGLEFPDQESLLAGRCRKRVTNSLADEWRARQVHPRKRTPIGERERLN